MNSQKNDLKSLLMLISSMVIFGTIGIFRRNLPLASALLACFRGFSGALFLILVLMLGKKPLRHGLAKSKVLLLIISGAMIGFNWILLFEAYNYTSIAVATLCYYMEPTIVILASPILFKEKLTGRKLLCAALAILGMVFVSGIVGGGAISSGDLKGILFGLGAAVLYSCVVLMNKSLTGVDAYEKTILQLASAAIVMVPYLAVTGGFSGFSLTAGQWGLLFIVGFVHTGLAYALYFGSMDGLRAQSVALLSYIDPVMALILAALILHESMSGLEIVGAVLILGTAAFGEI